MEYTLEQVIEKLKNGCYIKESKDMVFTLNDVVISDDIMDELFSNYNLAKWMRLKEYELYSMNPKYYYDYKYEKWIPTPSFKGE